MVVCVCLQISINWSASALIPWTKTILVFQNNTEKQPVSFLSLFYVRYAIFLENHAVWHAGRENKYNKNKLLNDHSVEIMWIIFAHGYFTSLQYEWNILTKNNEHEPQTYSFVYAILLQLDIDFNGLYVQF